MNPDFIKALKQIEKEREIPLEVILIAIEDALTSAYKRNYISNQDVTVKIDRATGELNASAVKMIVDKVSNTLVEISLANAKKIDPDAQLGMEIEVVVTPDDFGRIAAQTAKQVIVQRIREAERDIVFGEFTKRDEELVSGVVQRYEQKNYMVDLGRVEGVLPISEHVPTEHFKHGDRIKAVIMRAQKTPRGPQIILSRTSPTLVKRLFENEVPEISSGLIQIKSVVREPGNRSKIAVESKDSKIDPVGACVGHKGSRVQNIVDELKNEKIDIINWDSDPSVYIANSLSPSKVLSVQLYAYDKSALVIVPDHQLSLAIGKEGQNARLAAKLTGWKIDIKSESQYEENKEELSAKAAEMERLYNEELERISAEEKAAKKVVKQEIVEVVQVEPETNDEVTQEEPSEVYEESIQPEIDLQEQDENIETEDEETSSSESEAEYKPNATLATEPVAEDSDRAKKKKRKDRRVEEEREEQAQRRAKKKPKRSRSGEYDEYEYDSNWES